MDKSGGGFLAQGGYGCVYYPEVSCQGKDTNNKNFLSKIVQRDFSADNEINIGKLITTKLKMWVENPLQNHFAPVLSSCKVDISKFTMDEHEKCTLFEKEQNGIFNYFGLNREEGIKNLTLVKKILILIQEIVA